MKNKFFFILSLSLLFLNGSFAQYVPNGGFEKWENRVLYVEPVSWNTGNMESFLNDTMTAFKVNDSYSGEYALRLTSVTAEDDTLAGYAFCMGSYAGGDLTDTLLFNGGFPVSGAPDSVFGFFKYVLAAEDSAIVLVSFKKEGNIIGQNIFSLTGNQNSYKKIKWALNPMADTPDTAIIAFASTNPDNPKPGSWLQVDSVWFSGINDPIPNAGFEDWEDISCFEPAQWMTSNLFACLFGGDTSVTYTTDAHSGKYAIRIESIQSNMPSDSGTNPVVIGFAMPYSESMNFTEGISSFDIDFNPTLLTGYYKFIPLLNDTAVIYGYLKDEDENSYPFGTILLPSDTYQQFQIPLVYPEGVKITEAGMLFSTSEYFMQGDGKSGEVGSVLYLDNINLFNPCDTFPEYHIQDFEQPICGDNTLLLDAGEGWAEYLWSTEATTQTITIPAQTAASYSVTVTFDNGCKFYDTVEVTPPICDAIKDNVSEPLGVFVYPNPSSGEFTLDFTNAKPEHYIIEAATIEGKIIYKEDIIVKQTKTLVKIDLSNLPAGIYILKIACNKSKQLEMIKKL